ncbi:hypothetical protein [Nocardia niigatensis]
MFAAVWTFLTGLGIGGLVVWALFSFTALNPVHSPPPPKDYWTVQSITARIERERREGHRTGRDTEHRSR